ncbi:unnamed protein product [Ambrosiozyma monospora]|uniref:Unnamed protein product n=1 Tax=Ambrosiozyma monospora TaxID=43982 RepID=A0ACB5SZ57_AMBMO|nr:unnamed protein product [Ambrosiozyma monospora]
MSEENENSRKRTFDEVDDEQQVLPPHLQGQQGNEDPTINNDAVQQPPPHQDQDQGQGQYQQYQPQQQQQYQNSTSWSSKRTRFQLPPNLFRLVELTKDVCKLGEYPPGLAGDIDYVSHPIAMEFQKEALDDEFKTSILDYIHSMIIEQPHKLPIMSGLVQVCNAKAGKFGAFVLEYFLFKAQGILDGLKQETKKDDSDGDAKMNEEGGEKKTDSDEVPSEECGSFTRLKLIIRFIATLIPIIEDVDSVIFMFEQFLNIAIKLQEKNEFRSPLGELLYYETLVSIPYILASVSSSKKTKSQDEESTEGATENNLTSEIKAKCEKLIEIAKTFTIKKTPFPAELFAHFKSSNPSLLPYEPKNVIDLILPAVEKAIKDEDLSIFLDINTLISSYIDAALIRASEVAAAAENDTEDQKEEQETKPNATTKHALTQLSFPDLSVFEKWEKLNTPASGNVDSLWAYPRFVLEIFNSSNNDFDTVPKYDSYASLILRDVIQDLVQNIEFNRVTVSRQLLVLHFFFNEKMFAKPNSSVDKLTIVNDLASGVDLISDLENNKDIPEDMKRPMIRSARHIQREFDEGYRSTWKMEEIVADGILNLLFNLPSTSIPNMYYETLLADTCGRDWAIMRKTENSKEKVTFAKVLGGAIRFFYKNVKYLDFELRGKFADWMLLQLSNFNFDWAWNDWSEDLKVLQGSIYHPTIYLIKNVISKEIRVSTPATIKSTLPAEFQRFIRLSLKNKHEVAAYDAQFFGEKLSESVAQANFELEEKVEDVGLDAVP